MNVLIAGASGLVGNELLQLTLTNEAINSIHLVNRRILEIQHPKLEQHIVDFSDLKNLNCSVPIDTVFCSLGTTIKNAGSKEKFKAVDYDYVVNLAKWAESNGVGKFIVVSAMGADSRSTIFYSKIKGEMQEVLSTLHIPSISILQPSLLMGNRQEFRLGEQIGISIMNILNVLFVGPFKKYKAIHAITVATAMLNLSKMKALGITISSNDKLFEIAKLY